MSAEDRVLPDQTSGGDRMGIPERTRYTNSRRFVDIVDAIVNHNGSALNIYVASLKEAYEKGCADTARGAVGTDAAGSPDAASVPDQSQEVERLRAALRRIAEHGPSSARGWKHWADMAVDALAFDEEENDRG